MHKIILPFALSSLSLTALAADNPTSPTEQLAEITVATQLESYVLPEQNTISISGKALSEQYHSTLGDTLSKISGVQSESFGPHAGRPLIRGLGGQRVEILSNNLSLNDMAAISGNLPTPLESQLADSIEVTKGPATILHGGRAIGGTVNVKDGRIPSKIAEKRFQGKIEAQTGENTQRMQGFRLDVNDGRHWAWHISAMSRHSRYTKIPGNSKAAVCHDVNELKADSMLRDKCQIQMSSYQTRNPAHYPYLSKFYEKFAEEYELESSEKYTTREKDRLSFFETVANDPNPAYIPDSAQYIDVYTEPKALVKAENGRIPNSHFKSKNIAVGGSYIDDWGYVGLAYSHYQTRYGVPGFAYRASSVATEGDNFGAVDVLSQDQRFDLRAEIDKTFLILQKIKLSANYAKAQNIEQINQIDSSRFNTQQRQVRLEAEHQPWGNLHGLIGVEVSKRKIARDGADAYLPDVNSDEKSLFVLESLVLDPFKLSAGGRWSSVKHRLIKDYAGNGGGSGERADRTFDLSNYHIGLLYQPLDSWHVKLQRSFSQRAPEVNELYANNSHYSLLIEENGDTDLKKEKSNGWELSSGVEFNNWMANITWYQIDFSNYTYLAQTGIARRGTIVKEWRQTPIRLQGIETELGYHLRTDTFGEWRFSLLGDVVRSKAKSGFNGGGYVSAMPTSRYGAGIDWNYKNWSTSFSAWHYLKQDKVGVDINKELESPSFTLVDASISYQFRLAHSDIELYLIGKNLTNREARLHNSTLRYLAPMAGRSIATGVRWTF
ncbi:TonB-dependent receptor [Testudinibacter sp. P80/BLE/0925]|uniref:TonB-dependent receptor n=1 Tax=Testudinibacter sp. TW-1 TaxID=3417757 RepID=UPI003D3614F8